MEEKPDLIIGIDFGMTYTGVAWTNLVAPDIFVIKDWPGLGQDGHEQKVPSRLIYRGSHVSQWGFLCDRHDEYEEQGQIMEWFKIYLDPQNVERAKRKDVTDAPKSVEDAKRLVADYLREIYRHVNQVMESTSGSWVHKRVEFIFSMPTTWTNQAILNDFKAVIQSAGFGSEARHTATLELTEAEAVAVYTAKTAQVQFAKGDIFLICDAGGGTTDLGLVEVSDSNPRAPVLKQVAAVQGAGIGSTLIDRAFRQLVQRRLDEFPDAAAHLPEDLAFDLSRSLEFRNRKHGLGTAAGDQPTYNLPVNDINRDFVHAGLRISRGKMSFSRTEFQSLFDPHVSGIIGRIEAQLNWMKTNRSTDQVKCLILSGGLGSSEYVRSRVEAALRSNPHPNALNLLISKSPEPRLCVAKGLVMDRRQKHEGSAVITHRIARASYGVLCRQPYDPNKHVGEEIQMDEYIKGKRWAANQIDWFIRKGDIINTNTAREKPFERKLNPGGAANTRIWDTTLVISHNAPNALPRGLSKQAGASKLCTMRSDLSLVTEKEFELKNKRCWQGKKYYLAKFTIKVIVAPADLKFELWFKGQKYNRGHDSLKIDWDAAGASEKPPADDDDFEVARQPFRGY